MSPEEESIRLIEFFKEREMFEYDVVQKHATIRAARCCEVILGESLPDDRRTHWSAILKILNNKLK